MLSTVNVLLHLFYRPHSVHDHAPPTERKRTPTFAPARYTGGKEDSTNGVYELGTRDKHNEDKEHQTGDKQRKTQPKQ